MMRFDVVVVGAGQGGAQVASVLRQHHFEGTIAIIGDEIDPPYDRPALSKEYLAGEKTFEKMLLRPPATWSERRIELMLGKRVTDVDASARTVTLDDGASIGWGKLVWAAGGAPRKLTCGGHDLRGVHTVRSRRDVDRMREELEHANATVIIGGGYIGLEVAAVLAKRGKRVTVVEALDRVLARVAAEPLSRFFEREHRAHGVDVRLRTKVESIEERDGAACGVKLDAEVLAADVVVVGIGITPSIDPLARAGAETRDHGLGGVVVDLQGKTSLPDVFAIGDCASHANPHAHGDFIRLESIQNANDQAAIVAKAITGSSDRYDAIPTFWSNQYDLRLQTMGLAHGCDRVIVRGDVASRKFSLVYLRGGAVIAVDAVNVIKDYIQSKALIASKRTFDPEMLARADVELKTLLQSP